MQSRLTTLRVAGVGALVALIAGAAPVRAQAAKLDDPTIIAIFDAANTWDIEAGQLAAKKGSDKTVKDFGAMLVRDHTNVRQQGRDLATKLKVTPTPPKDFALAKVHADAMKKLEGLSGKDFDKAFLQNEVDYHQAVIDACAETGTWIELNANPYRFDMDWRHWPYAKSKGVKCVINCDAHRLDHAGFLRLGAGIARKGWLTKEDVINTLPLDKLKKELGRKRERLAR